jgi:molybdenum cofactor biosynthesis protein MoaC
MEKPHRGMVDVSGQAQGARRVEAEGYLMADPETIAAIRDNTLSQADPLPTARAAALLGIKQTDRLIPHGHPTEVTGADVEFEFSSNSVCVRCRVRADARTDPGVEALEGVMQGLLALFDMVKDRCPMALCQRIALVPQQG